MSISKSIVGFLMLNTLFFSTVGMADLENKKPQKIRTIVTTDPELDDNNSLIRLLLYTRSGRIVDTTFKEVYDADSSPLP
ncbi:hypothetical protein G8770_17710 [Aestuariicella hydrocarbonica]|uniref:Uncharacterized protein n=1 Tax=Pseudomaricurvus hydrocarbonicus TaxID=1470433 RepID=A0A9E5MNB2_9GAMM|nr:hypothetical protein [Aestuariicella hydrocarbonica]NHO67385.1 hypothetical protein [Aestuariicella hydrocarbonica]